MEAKAPNSTASANSKQIGGAHYKKTVQHWDYAWQLPYLDGQVSKYIDRHQQKNGFQDLLKAGHYLEKMMEVYYPEEYAKWKLESLRCQCLILQDGSRLCIKHKQILVMEPAVEAEGVKYTCPTSNEVLA